MIRINLPVGPLRVTCLGAHPDDIEIGCGATLLALAASRPLTVTSVVATGDPSRHEEALDAASEFLSGHDVDVRFFGLRDGHLPDRWSTLKDSLAVVGDEVPADIVFAPRKDDAHQDHRTIAELVPTVWRDALILHYEIPKWDGDHGLATHYVPVRDSQAQEKVALLNKCFPSQLDRDWWDDEMFFGLMRLRGMECRARYAEAFVVGKSVLEIGV